MSELSKNTMNAAATKTPEEFQRAHAVSAAIELIAGYVSSGSPVSLESEMKSLSEYADLIQAALKTK